jgi:hypothetical protein
MKKAFIIIIAVVFVLALCPVTFAQQQTSFRCGNTFVKEGTNSIAIQAGCGEPLVKEDLGARGRGRGKNVEKWVYGPEAGYYYVIMIEGGTVVRVEAVREQ